MNQKTKSILNHIHSVMTRLRHPRLFWLGIALTLVVLIYVCIPLILQSLMVVESSVHPADVIFIGTSLGNSLDVVIDLHQNGMVKQIVVVYDKERLIDQDGEPVALHEITMRQLMERGVPKNDVLSVQWDAKDKVEWQLIFRQWILEHKIKSYLSFVSTYHSRYSKLVHDATFPDGEVEQVMMISGSNRVWRKQILNLHNTMIRMFYWCWITEPQLRMKIKQVSLNGNSQWQMTQNLV